jgi:glycolate oxidase FAD binding subunit
VNTATSPAFAAQNDLAAITGQGNVREGVPADAVDAMLPALVALPGTLEEAAAILSFAQRKGWAVAPRGAGSKMGLGNRPRRLDLILESSRLNRVIEYAAGDLVVKVEAGLPLGALQEILKASGQRLAIDPPENTGTLGGIIATNASGPRRLRYGTVRDLLIGITFVLADGSIAKSGGKVVKNVAGYDMGKLFTGSLGTLGFIADATFRLHPLPSCSATLLIEASTPRAVGEVVQSLLHSPLTPSAIELDRTSERLVLAVLVEGEEVSVAAQADAALEQHCTDARGRIITGVEALEFWTRQKQQWAKDEIGLQITFPISALPHVLEAIEALEGRHGVEAHVRGRAGSGVLQLELGATETRKAVAIVNSLRTTASQHGGSCVVEQAPVDVKREIDVWGPKPDAWPLMQRVKAEFDRRNVMNPGRFIGGL